MDSRLETARATPRRTQPSRSYELATAGRVRARTGKRVALSAASNDAPARTRSQDGTTRLLQRPQILRALPQVRFVPDRDGALVLHRVRAPRAVVLRDRLGRVQRQLGPPEAQGWATAKAARQRIGLSRARPASARAPRVRRGIGPIAACADLLCDGYARRAALTRRTMAR